MKASSFSAQNSYPVFMGLLLLLLLPSASSIYIDPVTNTRRYPHVRIVTERLQQLGGDVLREAIVQQDIVVPLTSYQDHKVMNPPVADPLLSWYLDTLSTDEPHVLVVMSGRNQVNAQIGEMLEIEPPEGAQKFVCSTKNRNAYRALTETPSAAPIDSVDCLASFLNADFSRLFEDWLLRGLSSPTDNIGG